jgi:hypothetical protein
MTHAHENLDANMHATTAFIYALVLIIAAIVLWIRPITLISPNDLSGKLVRGYPRIIRYRLYAAFSRRREQMDVRLGRAAAIACYALAILSALRPNWSGYIPAIAALVLIPLTSYAYTHLRVAPGPRLATVTARNPVAVIGYFWFVAFSGASFVPFLLWYIPSARVSIVFTVAASLVTITCAWIVAKTPSVISAADPLVEQFADERLRRFRSTVLFSYINVVMISFVGANISVEYIIPTKIIYCVIFAQLTLSAVMYSQQRPVCATEVTRWFAAPVPEAL